MSGDNIKMFSRRAFTMKIWVVQRLFLSQTKHESYLWHQQSSKREMLPCLGCPSLLCQFASDVDLCINFLMPLLLICEFRLEKDRGKKYPWQGGQKT